MTPSGKVVARYSRNALVIGAGFSVVIAIVPDLGGPNPATIGGGVLGAIFLSFLAQFRYLDLICGEDMRVREAAAAAGAGAPATMRALVQGLRAAEESRVAAVKARQARGEVPVGARVAAVNTVLRQVVRRGKPWVRRRT